MTKISGSIAAVLAAAVALTSLPIGAASAADASKQPRAEQGTTFELSARKRHHHYRRGNSRAAMQMFGMVAGTIASIAAAQHARNYYDRYDGYGYYGRGYAPPPPYGYYGRPYGYW